MQLAGLFLPLMAVVGLVSSRGAAPAVTNPTRIGNGGDAATTLSVVPSQDTVKQEDVSVLWLQLDEAPLWPLLRSDGTINPARFPGFAALAAASTWFRNALSVSNYTVAAVPSGLTGTWSRPRALPVAGNYPHNLFTMMNGKRALDVSESVAALCPRDVCTASVVPAVRNSITAWEKGGARTQVRYVTDMIERAVAATEPTVHYAHVLLPHRPWQLTPDMRTTRFVTTDKRAATVEDRVRDEYQAFLAQYMATDRIILDLVKSLRASANWDRTMIIVTADHGLAFEPGESKRKEINKKRVDTLDEIYRVPLFVKFPGQASGDISDCAAQTFDVLPMVAEATGVPVTWKIEGESQRTHCRTAASRRITWYNGETRLTGGFGETLKRVERFAAWVDPDGSVDGLARPAGYEKWFEATVPTDGTAPADEQVSGWTLRDRELFASMETRPFAMVPLQVDGTIDSRTAVDPGAVGLVVMDGKVVAVVPELGGMRAGTNPWRSILLPSSLTAGRHAPVLWVARGTPAAPELTLVGTPG